MKSAYFNLIIASNKVGKESKKYDIKEWVTHVVYSVNQNLKTVTRLTQHHVHNYVQQNLYQLMGVFCDGL